MMQGVGVQPSPKSHNWHHDAQGQHLLGRRAVYRHAMRHRQQTENTPKVRESVRCSQPQKASMGDGDEEDEEQNKLPNLGFEASNPKRKKQTKTSFKPLNFFRPYMGDLGV
jgi:hypothetical protein